MEDDECTLKGHRSCLQNCIVTLVMLLVLAMFVVAVINITNFAKDTYRPDMDVALSETRVVHFDAQYFEGWIGGPASLNDPSPLLPHDNTTGKFIQLMKFATHPPLSVIDSWSSLLQTNITNARIFYWSRYFYTNSSFSIAWNVNIDLYDRKVVLPYWFVKATDNDHDSFVKATRDGTAIPNRYTIISTGYHTNITHFVQEDNFYFLFLWNNNTFDTRADFNINITSRILDVSNPLLVCTLPCDMQLPYNREGEALVLVSPSANTFVSQGYGSANSHFTFHAKIHPRRWFFAVILTFIAVGFVLVEFIVCCFYTTCDEIGEDVPTRFREVWNCVGDSGQWMKKTCCSKRKRYREVKSAKRGRDWADDSEDV